MKNYLLPLTSSYRSWRKLQSTCKQLSWQVLIILMILIIHLNNLKDVFHLLHRCRGSANAFDLVAFSACFNFWKIQMISPVIQHIDQRGPKSWRMQSEKSDDIACKSKSQCIGELEYFFFFPEISMSKNRRCALSHLVTVNQCWSDTDIQIVLLDTPTWITEPLQAKDLFTVLSWHCFF